MSFKLESIAYGDNVREQLKSDYVYNEHDCVNYAVFVDSDTGEILLKPAEDVEP